MAAKTLREIWVMHICVGFGGGAILPLAEAIQWRGLSRTPDQFLKETCVQVCRGAVSGALIIPLYYEMFWYYKANGSGSGDSVVKD